MAGPNAGLFWHVHHERLYEWCYDAEERRKYIRIDKPKAEIETRLRLMQPVRGTFGDVEARAAFDKAWATSREARAGYYKALADYERAWAEYAKARAKYDEALADYDKAWDEFNKAWDEFNKAWDEYIATIRPGEAEALHAIECPDCPWDGKTIFPKAWAK